MLALPSVGPPPTTTCCQYRTPPRTSVTSCCRARGPRALPRTTWPVSRPSRLSNTARV